VEIRRAGQSSQASAMIATNRNSVRPIHKGDLVSVFPNDGRDQGGHSRNGVEGIVINTPKKPVYAISVVTRNGIAGSNGTWGSYPSERYHRAHGTQPLDEKMGRLRRQVLGGTLERQGYRIKSLRELTRIAANPNPTSRPARRKCGCMSTQGGHCANNKCGCRKNGQVCNARCGCRGSCTNT
jgi:hypothetical protein